MTKRVIEREQSIMGRIFFIFKVNTVEKVLRDLFQSGRGTATRPCTILKNSTRRASARRSSSVLHPRLLTVAVVMIVLDR